MADEAQRLIQASQQGDVDAFNGLVQLYEGRVYTVCYRMLSDRDAASDAAQDAFLTAFRKLHTFRGGSFPSWLLRIATNICYDKLRAQQRRPSTSLDAAMDDPNRTFEPADPGESPGEVAERHELGALIQLGLAALPADQRLVVILSDVQGMPYADIARITDSNLGTVKSRLSRGRARLRDYLRTQELLPARYRQVDT